MDMKKEIIEYKDQLPSTIEELIDFVIVSNEAIQSFKAKLKACNKADIAKGARDQTLKDGRKISRLHLEAESRLGELLSKIPNKEASSARGTRSLPNGINKKESHYAQEIYKHPEFVKKVFTEKLNDIPSRHDVLKAIQKYKREQKAETPPIVLGQHYSVIYADPPWKYDFSETINREIEKNYPTMSLKELKELQWEFKDNTVLFMWATAPKLKEALELLNYWGFDYKTHLIWDKEKIGMGYWFRGQHELLMVGVKGKFSPPKEKDRIPSIIRIPRTEHSKKPDEIRDLIANWYPNHKKVELFARKNYKNWDSWGNEIK